MKFKTKEELTIKTIDEQYIAGIEDTFKSFAKRVEFYKKYRHKPWELEKSHQELVTKFLLNWFNIESVNEIRKEGIKDYFIDWLDNGEDLDWYDDWLFDYCFGDVIE